MHDGADLIPNPDFISRLPSRRRFLQAGLAASAVAALPTWAFAQADTTHRVLVRADDEIGVVRPDLHGHFSEHLGSCVYGGLWVGRNSSIPNVNGYRKQAVDYLRELGVPVLRWPGGCFADDYHWRDGIGPPAQRPKRVNIHWGNYVEDNSFGTHEFVGLCQAIGAEPYFAGNVGSGSPHELREWVEYCNYPSGSTLSDERARNGSPQPFNIKYWGVGNESWGCGGNMRPEHYADLLRDFAVYIREFGGTKPFLVASGPNGNDARWSRGVLDGVARDLPDGFSMHYYESGADAPTAFTVAHMEEQFAIFQKVEQAIVQQRALIDGYPNGRKVGLILDEWGVWDQIPHEDEKKYGALWQQSTMRSAVAAGLGLNIFNRQADKLYMCNIAQIVNVLQSLLLTDGPNGQHCVRTTTYYAFMLFKSHRSNTAVHVDADEKAPISASASKSANKLVISLVNTRSDADLTVACALRGVRATSGSAQVLHDPDLNAFNSFDQPDRIIPKTLPVNVEAQSVRVELPRLSVATITLQTSA